ncbi:MAG: FeS assembly protein SufB [candidate division TM6 bacterium GW2011_GWF2_28_16]|nr:MAG: FeS assembly protein SufB [candidate division TM6 bacterium GW2011_GWF2_28_16]
MFKSNRNCDSCVKSCDNNKNKKLYKQEYGLSEDIIKKISKIKNEPEFMLEYRLKAFEFFKNKKMQSWGPDLNNLNFDELCFYLNPESQDSNSWENVAPYIKKSFSELGVIKSEKENLAGLGAQYESEIIYHNLKKEWQDLGVIFLSTDMALQKHPELFKKYFGKVIDYNDNKFSALNSAVWSGGSFIYVPENVKINIPLQAYYRINEQNLGQFERTLIIADKNSSVSYVEGCTAKNYSSNSLHSAVVEIIAHENATVKYYTVQNWSNNVYNLVTKRAIAYKNANIEWVDANIGSLITMKYPSVILAGEGAKTSILSLAVAGFKGQVQDSGAKAIHLKPNTSSKIISKSISSNAGVANFRGKIKVVKNAVNCKSFMECDSLIIDSISSANAYPVLDIQEHNVETGHEASISKIADEKLFYLMSRGIKEQDAKALLINGFIDDFVKNLPEEYAIEISRLVNMQLNGAGCE